MTSRKKATPSNVPSAPVASKAQEKAMADLMDLVKGGFRREGEVQAQDRAGVAQPPASAPTEPRRQDSASLREAELRNDPSVPLMTPPIAVRDRDAQDINTTPVSQAISGMQEPRNPAVLAIQRPLGLDVPIQRRAIVTPKAKEKAMSATGSGWTKIGWYIQESTKAAADVEIRRLQTTGSEFLDLAVRHYISGLQMAGQDPEILLDEAGYMLQDLLKKGMTEDLRSRINALLQQMQS